MNTNPSKLTIVIPAKNEAKLLPSLLESLCRQDYQFMPLTKVYVADAGSTDGTPDRVMGFSGRLNVEVIPGGLPSVGRNAGARRTQSEYILFIDADMELRDRTIVRRALKLAERRRLHCVTTNIWCSNGNFRDYVLYVGSNLAQYASVIAKPFSTGMFMLFSKAEFNRLKGFNERALYAEDYLLAKRVKQWRFGIVRGHVLTSNRRFRSMGHLAVTRLFVKAVFNTFDESYFLNDQGYWEVQLQSD